MITSIISSKLVMIFLWSAERGEIYNRQEENKPALVERRTLSCEHWTVRGGGGEHEIGNIIVFCSTVTSYPRW